MIALAISMAAWLDGGVQSRVPGACDLSLERALEVHQSSAPHSVRLEAIGESCATAVAILSVISPDGRLLLVDSFPLQSPTADPIENIVDAQRVLEERIVHQFLVTPGGELETRIDDPDIMYENTYIWNIPSPARYDRAREENWPILCWSYHYESWRCAGFHPDGYVVELFSAGL